MATDEGAKCIRRVYDQWQSILSPEDFAMFTSTNFGDVWAEAQAIEDQQAKQWGLRFMRRLEPFIKTFETYSGVIDTLAQGYSPMAFVWGPIKFVLQIARQHTTVIDDILKAYGQIGEVLPRMHKIKSAFKDNDKGLKSIIGQIYLDIFKFHKQTYKIFQGKFFRGKAWHLWYTVSWGHFKKQFTSIIESLQRHSEALDKEAAATHYLEMAMVREAQEEKEEKFERSEEIRTAHEVFSWLSAAEKSQQDYLQKLAEKCHPETCVWLTDDEHIYPWIVNAQSNPVVWLTGKPGAGKSICASFMVQHLQTFADKTCLYYFCGHGASENDGAERESCELVLRTLAAQLLLQNKELLPLVHQAYIATLDSAYVATSSKPRAKTMKKLLREILESVGSTRIVLDGIDECPKEVQKEVLGAIRGLQKHAGDDCKILVSSRHEPQIDKEMSQTISVAMDGKTNDAIIKYIEYSVVGDGDVSPRGVVKVEDEDEEEAEKVQSLKEKFPEFPNELFDKAKKMLVGKAKGMFLWVRLVINELWHCSTEVEFEKALEELPDGLNAAYGRILMRISSENPKARDRALRILYWLCCAYRPIQSHELVDGIALIPGQTVLSRRTVTQNVKRDILDICAPLVERSPNGTLDLVHFSAKEYLLDRQSGLNQQKSPFIDTREAHFSIAFACVTNLDTAVEVIPRFSNGLTDFELESFVVQGKYGLQSYGHQFWAEHVKAYFEKAEVEQQKSDLLIALLERFSRILKGDIGQNHMLCGDMSKAGSGLPKLIRYPKLLTFIAKWLTFKSQHAVKEVDNSSSVAQKNWHLEKDETYLSLMQTQLEDIAERILAMDPDNLPVHLDEKDYDTFVSRQGFVCRFFDCVHRCNSIDERDKHEKSHIPSFVCPDCDFSERGFRTNNDLKKHTERYHMSAEDFRIPSSLHSMSKPRVSSRWNEEGRRVLRQSFTRVLQGLSSKLSTTKAGGHQTRIGIETDDTSTLRNSLPRNKFWIEDCPANLREVWENINAEKYQSLREFRNDLCQVMCNLEQETTLSVEDVKAICNREIEKATSSIPSFRNTSTAIAPQASSGRIGYWPKLKGEAGPTLQDDNRLLQSQEFEFPDSKKPYWSKLENNELIKLLERFGRNFLEIAKHYKTKTPGQIEEHIRSLIDEGREDLLRIADTADARLQPYSESDSGSSQSTPEPEDTPPSGMDIDDKPDKVIIYSKEEVERSLQNDSQDIAQLPEDFLIKKKKRSTEAGEAKVGESTETIEGTQRKRYKRRKYKAKCYECGEDYADEEGMKRHVKRIHDPKRKIWRCEDPTPEGRLLKDCKACKKPKGYSSFRSAAKHLATKHDFSEKTTPKMFGRWVKQHEEFNPSFAIDKTPSRKYKRKDPAPAVAQTTRDQNPPRLWDFVNFDTSHELPQSPPMWVIPQLSDPSHITRDQDSRNLWDPVSGSENLSFDGDTAIWHPFDVSTNHPGPLPSLLNVPSFEESEFSQSGINTPNQAQLVSNGTLRAIPFNERRSVVDDEFFFQDDVVDGIFYFHIASHRSLVRPDQVLIRPDEVLNLPHLNGFEKEQQYNTVLAYYNVLGNMSPENEAYQATLMNLQAMSRTLQQGLLEWRRRQTNMGPELPLSMF